MLVEALHQADFGIDHVFIVGANSKVLKFLVTEFLSLAEKLEFVVIKRPSSFKYVVKKTQYHFIPQSEFNEPDAFRGFTNRAVFYDNFL